MFRIKYEFKRELTVKSPSFPKIIAENPEQAPKTTFIITGLLSFR